MGGPDHVSREEKQPFHISQVKKLVISRNLMNSFLTV